MALLDRRIPFGIIEARKGNPMKDKLNILLGIGVLTYLIVNLGYIAAIIVSCLSVCVVKNLECKGK